uniref:Dirigent protein n=1 Tax=Lilium longiflorum TaxID=4690 RepID=A0A2K9YNF3_LILLO|nr:dirigent-like protein [Lilium longiflorum]
MGSYSMPSYASSLLLLLTILTTAICDQDNTTHLKFFLHNQLSGPNATRALVATAGPNKTASSFGSITVADAPLTVTVDANSTEIGRNQGTGAQVQESPPVTSVVQNFVFTGGDYNGSTLALIGQVTPLLPTWELAVVGGSGQFRKAQGYAIGQFAFLNITAGTTIVQYDVYVTAKN